MSSSALPLPAAAAARLPYIDALRGVACLWVILHHSVIFWFWGPRPGAGRIEALAVKTARTSSAIGWLGVNLFIVLSGFCLLYPLVRANPIREVKLQLRPFLRRRSWRILPPYYAALALFAAVAAFSAPPVALAKDLARHVVLVHNLSYRTISTINGSFWSLALEFQLYLVFPILVVVAARRGLAAAVGLTFCVSVATQAAVAMLCRPHDWASAAVWYYSLPAQWFTFGAGMVAAVLVARPSRDYYRPAIAAACCAGALGLLLLARAGQFGMVRDQLFAVAFAALIVALSRHGAAAAWNGRALRSVIWVGGISYSLYLIHQPVVHYTGTLVDRVTGNGEIRLAIFLLAALPCLIATGYVFHLAFERPFLKARASGQRSVPPAVASANEVLC